MRTVLYRLHEMRKELLTTKQLLFCNEYLKDFNGRRAYKTVYEWVTDETADVNASKLLSNTKVKEYIEEHKEKIVEKQLVTVDWVVEKLKLIAEAWTTKEIIETKHWTREKYVDLTNANSALEKLWKYLKIYTDKIESEGNVNVNVLSYKDDADD